jgi:hypothetical protein
MMSAPLKFIIIPQDCPAKYTIARRFVNPFPVSGIHPQIDDVLLCVVLCAPNPSPTRSENGARGACCRRILSHFVAFPSHFFAFPSHFVAFPSHFFAFFAFLFHPLPAFTAYITCPYARFPVDRLSHFSHFSAELVPPSAGCPARREKNEERKTKK